MKALTILKEGLDFMNQAIKVNPNSVKELQSEIDRYIEAVKELESLECQDKLAELEKAILDYYLVKGYQVGVGGWTFKVNISTLYKIKDIQIMFRQDICSNWETIFRTDEETTKEMWDKAIKYFRSEK